MKKNRMEDEGRRQFQNKHESTKIYTFCKFIHILSFKFELKTQHGKSQEDVNCWEGCAILRELPITADQAKVQVDQVISFVPTIMSYY